LSVLDCLTKKILWIFKGRGGVGCEGGMVGNKLCELQLAKFELYLFELGKFELGEYNCLLDVKKSVYPRKNFLELG